MSAPVTAVRIRTTLLVVLALTVAGVTAGSVLQRVAGDRMAPWIIGRAAGLCSYLLLVTLVALGLVLSHPARDRMGGSTPARVRTHIALALFTFAFTVLHVVVLATDRYAGVGWWGALVPMGASYRPLPVTLGLIGIWSGLLSGVTAAAAGRLPRRLWWPLHKIAAVAFVLVWLHGVLAGGDTAALLAVYLATGIAVLALAASRYTSARRRTVPR